MPLPGETAMAGDVPGLVSASNGYSAPTDGAGQRRRRCDTPTPLEAGPVTRHTACDVVGIAKGLVMLETRFTRLVGCAVPIQQAPMGSVSSPSLAAAVADAGGVGSVPTLGVPLDQLETMLSDTVSRTSGVLAANFLTNNIDRNAVEAAAAHVRVLDFFWADPDSTLVNLAHEGGALVSWQVGSVAEAQAAADAGCDVVVVQGIEAGGHVRGHSALLPLLSAALEAIEVPILAAGGIGDGRALAAVLAAGADGARVGTRFIATAESGAHPHYKQAVLEADAGATEITDAFSVCPLCATSPRARVLRTCITALAAFDDEAVGEVSVAGQTVSLPKGSGLTPGTSVTGCVSAMALYASDAVGASVAIERAAQVIERLCTEAVHRLTRH
jgi:nitronate monooxygenase